VVDDIGVSVFAGMATPPSVRFVSGRSDHLDGMSGDRQRGSGSPGMEHGYARRFELADIDALQSHGEDIAMVTMPTSEGSSSCVTPADACGGVRVVNRAA
jgi:hypothetical protein